LTHRHAGRLIEEGATTIVLACNTASAAALESLRQEYPATAFVGMEPALKPAAKATKTNTVAVIATAATFQGRLFASLMDRFAEGLEVLTAAAPQWVELVEVGDVAGVDARAAVTRQLAPLLDQGADTFVLGCTHFTFLSDVIAQVIGDESTLIDPAPAVARRARDVHVDSGATPLLRALVSGDASQFEELSKTVAGISFPDGVLPL
jgi:glutamate racemase